MTTQEYVLDQAWHGERERLAGIEAMWDPATTDVLWPIVTPGCRALEVGAGGGSIAEWLVSRGARVVATDLDTRFVEPLAGPLLEVRQHDLRSDPLPVGEFDIVHTRMLVEHLPDRRALIAKLAAALKPGGWLVVEDNDFTGMGLPGAPDAVDRAVHGMMDWMAMGGFDATYGRRAARDLAAAGLTHVAATGRVLLIDADEPGFAFYRGSIQQMAPKACAAGYIDPLDHAIAQDYVLRSDVSVISQALISATGRRA